MARLAIALLGTTRITVDGRAVALGAKGRALLAYLALNAGQPQHRAAIADLLWPGAKDPRKSLRVELTRIQKALGSQPIRSLPDDWLAIEANGDIWLDVAEFDALLDAVQAHSDPDDRLCAECARKLASAADLYGGALLPEIDHLPELEGLREDVLPQRNRLHIRACQVFLRAATAAEARGADAEAERFARHVLALDPADEAAHCCLMRLFLRQARLRDAALQYELCRSALADLDATPGDEAAELFAQIAQQRKRAAPLPRPAPAARVATAGAAPRNTDRALMLERVAATWKIGQLSGRENAGRLIDLALAYRPGAVAAPSSAPAHERAPARSAQIAEIFDQASGELLILGAPGAGKTTLLLLLARALLARAQADARQPIPVLFRLSSWARPLPLAEWCAEQLADVYGVPLATGRAWIAARLVLPLLDGLDEVRADERAACVAAIDQFRQQYGLIRLAVCCRAAQYQQLGARLTLAEAVEVQPLTPAQIDGALAAGPSRLADVRAAIAADPALQQLAATPLMLSFLEEAYERISLAELRALGPLERQRYLSAAYVQCQLEAHARQHRPAHYRSGDLARWLGWLAARMQQQHEALFLLDHLAPPWLATARQQAAYAAAEKLAFGLIVGATSGVIWSLTGGLNHATLATPLARLAVGVAPPGTLAGLRAFLATALGATALLGVAMALAVWLASWLAVERRRVAADSQHFCSAVSIGCTVGAIDGVVAGLWNGQAVPGDGSLRLLANVGLGLLVALAAGLGAGFVFWRAVRPNQVLLVETFSWAWPGRWVKRGVVVCVLLGAIYGLTVGASEGVLAGLMYGMALGLANGLVAGLLCGFLIGVKRGQLADRMEPNQGIRLSAAAATRSGLLTWLAVGLTAVMAASIAEVYFFARGRPALVPWIVLWNSISWSIWALSFGVGAALLNGGFACVQHALLRLILRAAGALPLRAIHMLDEAVACNLLLRAGGGYGFAHELIQQHFAAQAAPAADPPDPPLIERTV